MNGFRLKGIKGFIDTGYIELKPITIFLGKNSSGKSSILRFPLVLKQTFLDDSVAPLLFYGKSIDYGNFEDVVFNHEKSRPIEFEISVSFRDIIRLRPFFSEYMAKKLKDKTLTISVTVSENKRTLNVDRFVLYEDNDKRSPLIICETNSNESLIKVAIGENSKTKSLTSKEIPFDKFIPNFRFVHLLDEDESKDNKYSRGRSDDIREISFLLSYYFNILSNNIYYIGPFRKTPERFYRYTENAVDYVGSDGEFAPVILGQNLRLNGDLLRAVSEWLERNLKFRLDIEELKGDIFKLIINDMETNAKNNIIDVGHGLSQLIPIVVQTFMRNNIFHQQRGFIGEERLPIINIIEQPELHLHPAAQTCLADLFVEAVKSNKTNRKIFMIETHSEHMVLRLRRYVVEEKINKDDIAVYFTEKDKRDGSCKVKRLNVVDDGRIEGWPEDFFSDDYLEVIELQKAIRKKNNGGDNPLWS